MDYLRRTWVEVSLDALEFNYRQLRKGLPRETRFLGVVKADAYGHGAIPIGRRLEELGAEFFAVSNVEEAAQLRRGGIGRPILILGYTPPSFAVWEAEHGVRQEVNCLEYARQLSESLCGSGRRLRIHLKLDTGMSRLGFFAYDRPETVRELAELAKLPGLEIEGAFQHFCAADSHEPDCLNFTELQYRRFTELLREMEGLGLRPRLRHCCNSAAAILHPEYAMDMIRPGIATYGYPPDPCMEGDLELRPLLSWKTTVAQLKTFAPGIPVSYGRTWTTERETRIAVLPVGYADGLSRRLSGRVEFLVNGKRVRQVGRICMDMCMADVTGVPDIEVGGEAVILGSSGGETASCAAMAAMLDTITYEITCDVGKRVARVYTQDGRIVETLRTIV